VFKAKCKDDVRVGKRTGKVVAVKKIIRYPNGIHPAAAREFHILTGLKHHNVIELLEMEICNHNMILVLEYFEWDLHKYIKAKPSINPLMVKVFSLNYSLRVLCGSFFRE
jgi:serine/threonine protein kinase